MWPKWEKTMTLQKGNTESTPEENTSDQTMVSSVDTKYCTRKRSEEAGFMDNAKENIKFFVHASLDEHKACFKGTWHKVFDYAYRMTERFQDGKSAGLVGQNTPVKN